MEQLIGQQLCIDREPDRWVASACLLYSNGCGLDIAVRDERIVGMRGRKDHPVNFGHLGPKGENAWVANASPRRGTTPMVRRHKGAPLEPIGCDEAYSVFMERFDAARKLSHDNVACYNSGQLTIEEFYALAKLWRGGLQSSNIDGNTRLCTATSATGLMADFGADGPVAGYTDIDQTDLLCLYGPNVAEAQRCCGSGCSRPSATGCPHHRRRPAQEPTVRQGADLHLQTRLGTNVALMNGILHLLIANGQVNRGFVESHTVGYEQLAQVVPEHSADRVADICGIEQHLLETAAAWIGSTARVVSTVLQGFCQSVEATAASSLVNSVHLLKGAIGKAFIKPAHWRRQPNPPAEEFPFVLNTGRVVHHFHTRTKTGRSEELSRRIPHAYVEIHPEDALRLGIALGDLVEVSSPEGRWEGPAIVVDTVRPGEIFIPFHFGHGTQSANQHTWFARDPVSQQPQFKSAPVTVQRKSFSLPERWLLDQLADLDGRARQPYAARLIGGGSSQL